MLDKTSYNKPLVFLGTNTAMKKLIEVCDDYDIEIAGIIDSDYYNNTETFCDLPIIDTEDNIDNYKEYNFFCATNWVPFNDAISIRNRGKRNKLINLIFEKNLNCISLVDRSARLSKFSKIGIGCYIDGTVNIEPNVQIGNFTNIFAHTDIGHDSVIGNNCVIQRQCAVSAHAIIEDDVFFSTAVKALKTGAKFQSGTFIHECIYIRRGTIKNETVSMDGGNQKRIKSFHTVD